MANSILNRFNAPTQPQRATAPQHSNPMQMMQQFQQFKANFRGDPQQEVQKLLNSGRMTQQQYNQLQQMAVQMSQMMGR